MEVQLDDIPVMYIVSTNGPLGTPAAFEKLRDAMDLSTGYHYYGTLFQGEYRACVAIDENHPEKPVFKTWTIPNYFFISPSINLTIFQITAGNFYGF